MDNNPLDVDARRPLFGCIYLHAPTNWVNRRMCFRADTRMPPAIRLTPEHS